MEIFEKSQCEKFEQLLSESKHVVVVAHQSPDGDALGSLMGLYHILQQKKVNVTPVLPDPVPEFIQWLDQENLCKIYQKDPDGVGKIVEESDLLIILDFNTPHRAGEELGALIKESNAFKVMFDHHPYPDLESFDLSFSNTSACATAEIIGDWLLFTGQSKLINQDVASALYLGLVTDSGSFRFSSVTSNTHTLAGEFLKTGINHAEIHDLTFNHNELGRLRLMGYALSEKLVKIKNHNAAYISLNEKELKKFYATKGDTEGLVNYALSLKGVTMGVFFKEQEGLIKISFRSSGVRAVNEMASKYFNGGGHLNAAGGRYKGKIEEAIDHFKEVLENENY